MPSRTLLLALALCAAAAAAHAACEEPFADIDSALLDQAKALTDAVIKQYATLAGAIPTKFVCPADGPTLAFEACQQAIGGDAFRYRLGLNLTCPDTDGKAVLVALHADVLRGADGNLEIINVDDDDVFVDGLRIGGSLIDLNDDDTSVDSVGDKLGNIEESLDASFGGVGRVDVDDGIDTDSTDTDGVDTP